MTTVIMQAIAFNRLLSSCGFKSSCFSLTSRLFSFYPIDDTINGFTSEQVQLREAVFNFAQKELAPYAQEIDKNDEFKQFKEFFMKVGKLGYHGITVPEKYGGTKMGYFEHALVLEEIARANAGIACSYATHSNLCINQIVRNANERQKIKYLPKLLSGEHIGALAMSEVEAGSDVLSMKLRADKSGNQCTHYILNGTKYWITNGSIADVIFVYARTNFDIANHKHGISAFIIEKGMPGFSSGKVIDKLGMRGSPTAELIFDNCKVPVENLVSDEGQGVYVLMSGLDTERLMLGAICVGIMQACCDVAFQYIQERKQFGRKLGEFQLIQGKVSDMYTTLNACRSYLYNVARSVDKGHIISKDCAGVALFCAEKSTKLASLALQCLGGNGYTTDYPTGRHFRDAKVTEIFGGTTEIRRLIIGRAINKEYE